jgi:hypothetical protein
MQTFDARSPPASDGGLTVFALSRIETPPTGHRSFAARAGHVSVTGATGRATFRSPSQTDERPQDRLSHDKTDAVQKQ